MPCRAAEAFEQPDMFEGDLAISSMLSHMQKVLAPHLSALVTECDREEFSAVGFKVSGLLDLYDRCCKNAKGLHAVVVTASKIAEAFPKVQRNDADAEGATQEVFAEYAHLGDLIDQLPCWTADEEHTLVLKVFKSRFSVATVAAPRLERFLGDLRSAVKAAFASVVNECEADFAGFYQAAHNVRKLSLWGKNPDELKESLNFLEDAVAVGSNVQQWVAMAKAKPSQDEWTWTCPAEAVDTLKSVAAKPLPMKVALAAHVGNDLAEARARGA